jgi:RNA polymerase sigma-70 factor (ECF subfamily)
MAGVILPVLREPLSSNFIQGAKRRKSMQNRKLQPATGDLDEADLLARLRARDADAFRTVMQRYNQRLYRIARSILQNGEAEDAVQDAYVRAFSQLAEFRGEARFATWLTRIVINEALGRLRARRRTAEFERRAASTSEAEIIPFPGVSKTDDPERALAQREILHLVHTITDGLPDAYRIVFVARVIEGLSVEETAEIVGIQPETVKTRLHRARRLVREQLDKQIGPVLMDAFPFAGRRCERLTSEVMQRLGFPG